MYTYDLFVIQSPSTNHQLSISNRTNMIKLTTTTGAANQLSDTQVL
jgi:hypothetical protein